MNPRRRHLDVLIIIGYIIAVLAGAALLAPLLFAGGQWFLLNASARGWRDSSLIGWVVQAAEKTEFPGYFDRAALIVALAGLWPLFRVLRMTRAETIGMESAAHGIKNAALGFVLAAAVLGMLGVLFSMLGVCRIPESAPW